MSKAINGYNDPYRSDALNEALGSFENNKKVWEGFHPAWYQTASKMRWLGTFLLLGGIAMGAMAATGALSGRIEIPFWAGGAGGGVVLSAGGITLLAIPYGRDPAYCQSVREKILDTLIVKGYDAYRANHGSTNQEGYFVSDDEIRATLIKYQKIDETPYEQMRAPSYKNKSYVKNHEEVRDSAYIKKVMKKPYDFKEIAQDLHSNLNPALRNAAIEEGQKAFLEHTEKMTALEIIDTYGMDLGTILKLSVGRKIEKTISKKFLEETEKLSWLEIYQTYNKKDTFWPLFTWKILDGSDFQEKLVQHVNDDWKTFFRQEKKAVILKLLDYELIKPENLRAVMQEEFQNLQLLHIADYDSPALFHRILGPQYLRDNFPKDQISGDQWKWENANKQIFILIDSGIATADDFRTIAQKGCDLHGGPMEMLYHQRREMKETIATLLGEEYLRKCLEPQYLVHVFQKFEYSDLKWHNRVLVKYLPMHWNKEFWSLDNIDHQRADNEWNRFVNAQVVN